MTYTPPPMRHNKHPDPNHRYSCFDKADSKKVEYWMQDGWTDDGRRHMVKHVTEWKDIGCGHHEYRKSDPGCTNCKWR